MGPGSGRKIISKANRQFFKLSYHSWVPIATGQRVNEPSDPLSSGLGA